MIFSTWLGMVLLLTITIQSFLTFFYNFLGQGLTVRVKIDWKEALSDPNTSFNGRRTKAREAACVEATQKSYLWDIQSILLDLLCHPRRPFPRSLNGGFAIFQKSCLFFRWLYLSTVQKHPRAWRHSIDNKVIFFQHKLSLWSSF